MLSAYIDKVFCKDVMEVLRALPNESIDMVYSDPDYNVGVNYAGKRYTKKWDAYIDWYGALMRESMRVLKPSGNLFTINYPRQNAYLWVKYLDALAYDVHEYVWVYNTNVGHSRHKFTRAHRSILHARKSKANQFYKDQVYAPYQNPKDRRIRQRIAAGSKGRMPYSWVYANLVKNVSRDKTIHACQIPLRLYDLLLRASTRAGDLVFVHFGGSGSEIVHTKACKRHYVSCEFHSHYHALIEDRLRHGGAISDRFRLVNASAKKKRPLGDALLIAAELR